MRWFNRMKKNNPTMAEGTKLAVQKFNQYSSLKQQKVFQRQLEMQ